MHWCAPTAARTHQAGARVPFAVQGLAVGSVARQHLPLLRRHAPWLHLSEDRVQAPTIDEAAFAALHAALRSEGAIRAWRDEPFWLFDPATLATLVRIERAAARFWGALTLGAHATGYVRDAGGAIAHLWIARRSPHKATDPGLLDNLIGGGVPAGQSPRECLLREAFEEAGLSVAEAAAAVPGSVLRLHRDIAEGFQQEWLYSYDLELPAGRVPQNQDGEVAAFSLMTVAEAHAASAGEDMTVDAALVTLDFLQRHGLVNDSADQAAALNAALEPVRLHELPPAAAHV